MCAGAEHKFLCDHVVDGRILMPATSYVVTAWEALCSMKSRKMEETPVVFEDVQIRQAVTAEEGQKIALAVLIAPDNRFCVSVPFCLLLFISSGMTSPMVSLLGSSSSPACLLLTDHAACNCALSICSDTFRGLQRHCQMRTCNLNACTPLMGH
jgi:hypothetical protein